MPVSGVGCMKNLPDINKIASDGFALSERKDFSYALSDKKEMQDSIVLLSLRMALRSYFSTYHTMKAHIRAMEGKVIGVIDPQGYMDYLVSVRKVVYPACRDAYRAVARDAQRQCFELVAVWIMSKSTSFSGFSDKVARERPFRKRHSPTIMSAKSPPHSAF